MHEGTTKQIIYIETAEYFGFYRIVFLIGYLLGVSLSVPTTSALNTLVSFFSFNFLQLNFFTCIRLEMTPYPILLSCWQTADGRPCHNAGGWSPASHCADLGSTPSQFMRNLWGENWYLSGFHPSNSIFVSSSHCTNCCVFFNHPIIWPYMISIMRASLHIDLWKSWWNIQFSGSIPTFQRNFLLSFSGSNCKPNKQTRNMLFAFCFWLFVWLSASYFLLVWLNIRPWKW